MLWRFLSNFHSSDEFGFEADIVWTKPCHINSVTKNSPAEKCHLEPGDFIIFIDKLNVVNLNRNEILSIISKSDAITLEVFRRTSVKMQNQVSTITPTKSPMKPPLKSQASIKIKKSSQHDNSIESISNVETMKLLLTPKSSTESKKKHLVTFSKKEVRIAAEVGGTFVHLFLISVNHDHKFN